MNIPIEYLLISAGTLLFAVIAIRIKIASKKKNSHNQITNKDGNITIGDDNKS